MATADDIRRRIAETVQPRLGRIADNEVGIYPVSGDAVNWSAKIAAQGGGGHAYRQWRLDQLRTAIATVRREMPHVDWDA